MATLLSITHTGPIRVRELGKRGQGHRLDRPARKLPARDRHDQRQRRTELLEDRSPLTDWRPQRRRDLKKAPALAVSPRHADWARHAGISQLSESVLESN